MKNIFTVIKKELARFFGDKRLIVTTVLLPGILIYVLYSLMGSFITDIGTVDEDYEYKTYIINQPQIFTGAFEKGFELLDLDGETQDDIKQKIYQGDCDLLIVFPENFDEDMLEYDVFSGQSAPNVQMYYNSAETNSYSAYYAAAAILNTIESTLSNKFDINSGEAVYDLATQDDVSTQIISMILPMLLLVMLFSGCMAVAPESIAGEKERGTVATLLVTPLKRSHLAIGKIVSLSVVAVLSGISSFIGIILALPKLMGGIMAENAMALYGFSDYLMLFGVVISTVLLLVSLISVISALAKSVKEANSMVTPLMITVTLLGVFSMFSEGAAAFWYYLIPVFNSAVAITAITSFAATPLYIVLCIAVNLVFTVLLVLLLTLMFKSEKIMFSNN